MGLTYEPTTSVKAMFSDRESLDKFHMELIETGKAVAIVVDYPVFTIRWETPLRVIMEAYYLSEYETVKSHDSEALLAFGRNNGNHIAEAMEPWEYHLASWGPQD
jgi:hypothetical protein